jgi:hypothetical protein
MATFPEAPIALRCKQRLEGVEEAIRKQEEKKEKAKAKKK